MNFLNKALLLFVAKAVGLLTAWFLIYELWLHPNGRLDEWVINATLFPAQWALKVMGYTVYTGGDRLMGIDGTNGIWMGDKCNGISLFAIFSIIIAAFPGKQKNKIWYIPAGILFINLLNIIRIDAICLVQLYAKEWLNFNHNVTFQYLMYALIFLMWMLYINKFSGLRFNKKEQ